MAGNQTSHACDKQQGLKDNSASLVLESLVVELQDGNSGCRAQKFVQVVESKEHGDAIGPGSDEADHYCGHDRNRDVLLGLRYLLRQVCCGVQAGEDPVRVDQANDECNAILLPSCGIDKVAKDV